MQTTQEAELGVLELKSVGGGGILPLNGTQLHTAAAIQALNRSQLHTSSSHDNSRPH